MIYGISTADFEIENIEIYGGFDEKNDLSSINISFFYTFFAFSIFSLRFSFLYSFIILFGIDVDSAIRIIITLIILIYSSAREKIEPASNIRKEEAALEIFFQWKIDRVSRGNIK
jgi:hypothetical protein